MRGGVDQAGVGTARSASRAFSKWLCRPKNAQMKTFISRNLTTIVLCSLTLVLATAFSAGAAKLITGKQIKDNTVTTKDIKNGTLRPVDFGAAASAALQGAPGRDGVSGYEVVKVTSEPAINGASSTTSTYAIAVCPAGKHAIGGGANWTGVALGTVNASYPITYNASGPANAWRADGTNTTPNSTLTLETYVVCATIQ